MFLPSTRIVTLSSFLFFGLGISCSVESTNALKPGKYSSSTSSIYGSGSSSCTFIQLLWQWDTQFDKRF